MKKYLLIAGLVCTVIIPPAGAVTKCVELNSSTTCTSNYTAYYNKTDWAATCNTNGVSIPISGIGICSSTQGTQYQTAAELDRSSTLDENINCWCKMTSPAVSRWVYVSTPTYADGCFKLCAYYCANTIRIQSSTSFRSALFSNLSD